MHCSADCSVPPRLITTSLVIAEGHGWFLKRYDAIKGLQFLSMVESMPSGDHSSRAGRTAFSDSAHSQVLRPGCNPDRRCGSAFDVCPPNQNLLVDGLPSRSDKNTSRHLHMMIPGGDYAKLYA